MNLCETAIMLIWMHISTSSHTLSSEISFYWLSNIPYSTNETDVDDTKVFNSPIHHFLSVHGISNICTTRAQSEGTSLCNLIEQILS